MQGSFEASERKAGRQRNAKLWKCYYFIYVAILLVVPLNFYEFLEFLDTFEFSLIFGVKIVVQSETIE